VSQYLARRMVRSRAPSRFSGKKIVPSVVDAKTSLLSIVIDVLLLHIQGKGRVCHWELFLLGNQAFTGTNGREMPDRHPIKSLSPLNVFPKIHLLCPNTQHIRLFYGKMHKSHGYQNCKIVSSGSGKHDGLLKVVSMKKEFQTIFMLFLTTTEEGSKLPASSQMFFPIVEVRSEIRTHPDRISVYT
jgi:hypothetical protein